MPSRSPVLSVRIAATGVSTPERVITSTALDDQYGRAAGTTQARSGVVARRWVAPGVTTSAQAAAAVRSALDRAGWDVTELDALVVTSAVPEQPMPTTAVLTLGALGIGGGAVEAVDVNMACLGFLKGLQVAAQHIALGSWRRVAVVSSELASRGLNHADIESSALFGDGAGAAVLEATPREGPVGEATFASALVATRFATYPQGAHLCEIAAGGTRRNVFDPPADDTDYLFRMNGPGVMKLAMRHLPPFLDRVLDEAGVARADLSLVVPHQASGLGLRYLREKLGFPPGQVVDILATHGNQVSASIPTALDAAIASGRLHRGDLVLLLGTGAGLTLGAVLLRY